MCAPAQSSALSRMLCVHPSARLWEDLGGTRQMEVDEDGAGPPRRLPTSLTSFVGRTHDLEGIGARVPGQRLVTLTGTGGCGKTRLALELCGLLHGRFNGGVRWVDLATIASNSFVASQIGEVLGLRETPGERFIDTLTRLVGPRDALLVLDNCEHVIDGVAAVIDALLRGGDRLHVLATSREPLAIAGEMTWRVGPLGLAVADGLELSEATRLFLDRAELSRPGYDPSPDDLAMIDRICARLDGVALAIELAAARMTSLAPESILAGLDDRFRLLTGGARTAVPRQRTLEASVQWSYDLLSDAERTVFRRVAVFSGGFTSDDAAQVCRDDELSDGRVLDVLPQLASRSMLRLDPDGRYAMLETVRQFAQDRLVEDQEAVDYRVRHLHHFSALIEQAVPGIEAGDTARQLSRLYRELPNVRAALDFASSSGRVTEGLRLACAWPEFWAFAGHTTEGSSRVRAFVEAVVDPCVQARALAALATIGAFDGSDLLAARRYGTDAIERAARCGEPGLAVRPRHYVAFVATMLEPDRAGPLLEEALAASDEAGDAWISRRGRGFIALTNLLLGHHQLAAEQLDVLAADCAAADDMINLGNTLAMKSPNAVLRGFGRDTVEAGEAARVITRSIGDRVYSLMAEGSLGWGLVATGDHVRGLALLQATINEAREVNLFQLAWALAMKAWASASLGDLPSAEAAGREALPLLRSVGLRPGVVICEWVLGRLALFDDDTEAAGARFDAAEDAAGPVRPLVGLSGVGKALLARHEQRILESEQLSRDALWAMGPDALGTIIAIEALASALAQHGNSSEAAIMLAAAYRGRLSRGVRRWDSDEAMAADTARLAKEALDLDAFGHAWTRGTNTSLGEAVSFATRARGTRRHRPTAGWESVTPTEQEVVVLVAEGLTNKAIAERLFMSARTVQSHLTHVFAKVGVANRSELVAAMRKAGWPTPSDSG